MDRLYDARRSPIEARVPTAGPLLHARPKRREPVSPLVTSFALILAAFALVGGLAARRSRSTISDYLIADGTIGPRLTALSAWATAHSGFGFIGQIGFIYTSGVSALWLTVGWFLGDYLAWRVAFASLRTRAAEHRPQSWPQMVGLGSGPSVRVMAAVLTVAMLSTYAAAQLQAGAKAMQTVTGWSHGAGVVLGALLIAGYSAAGGVRAAIWTDVAQSVVMLAGMVTLAWAGVDACGGLGAIYDDLARIDPALLSWTPREAPAGPGLFALGWVVAGFGVVGQPHVMTRLLSLRSTSDVAVARKVNASMSVLFTVASLGVGLSARVLLPELGAGDAEQSLPLLASKLLPGVMVGALVAAIFAAAISTADSQVLTCASALTVDLTRRTVRLKTVEFGTILVIVVAAVLAWWRPANVFGLVIWSWSVLAATLGPVVLYATWRRPTSSAVSLVAMLVGISVVIGWRLAGWNSIVHELVPSVVSSLAVLMLGDFIDGTEVPAKSSTDDDIRSSARGT